MFEAHFDDLKRRMKEKGTELHKVITCFRGTPEYETYMSLFVMPENTTLHYTADANDDVYTFYTILNSVVKSDNSKESV